MNNLGRFADPIAWLVRYREIVNPGGLVIVSFPLVWNEDFTYPNHWIGTNGQDNRVDPNLMIEALRKLFRNFELLGSQTLEAPSCYTMDIVKEDLYFTFWKRPSQAC
jgi:hypothetical protein